MTKIKIADFDKSKPDGRPRTGFVQVDFMLMTQVDENIYIVHQRKRIQSIKAYTLTL